jgi:hypothetical protein
MAMPTIEQIKTLKALVRIKEVIEKAKETGIGLYDAGIFASGAGDDVDADNNAEEDESESK